MNSLLLEDIKSIDSELRTKMEVTAIDTESLLVEWLNDLWAWVEMDRVLFCDFTFNSVAESAISIEAAGGRPPELLKHIKAVNARD